MKNTRHNLKKQILFMGFFVALFLFLAGVPAHAVVLESGIPGVGTGGAQGQTLPSLPEYINYLYIFVLSFVGIAGFISLVIWGTVWVGSAVVDKKTRAIEGIKSTLIGIGIALTAFILLYTINPDLTVIKMPFAPKVNVSTPSVASGEDMLLAQLAKMPPHSMTDGGKCFLDSQCFFGSICVGKLYSVASGQKLGVCERSSQGLEPFCKGYDSDPTTCLSVGSPGPQCSWCPTSGSSGRCVQKTNCQ